MKPHLVFLLLGGILLAPDCSWSQDLSLREAKEAFAKADRDLNEIYQVAKKSLSEGEFEKVREAQRNWLSYRDQRAGEAAHFDGGAREGEEEQTAAYWSTRCDLSRTRIEILEATMKVNTYAKTWEGVWIDGYGGILSIEEGQEASLRFTLRVVRGPTYHTGAIEGTAQCNVMSARFEIREEGVEGTTWITFLREGGGLRLIGENTQYFHGARAYFDGTYLRVRELTTEDLKEIASAID